MLDYAPVVVEIVGVVSQRHFTRTLLLDSRILEGILKIMLGSWPSAAPSAGSSRASGAFHSSVPSAHNLCSSGAAAPTSPACVPQSSTTVSRQIPRRGASV